MQPLATLVIGSALHVRATRAIHSRAQLGDGLGEPLDGDVVRRHKFVSDLCHEGAERACLVCL